MLSYTVRMKEHTYGDKDRQSLHTEGTDLYWEVETSSVLIKYYMILNENKHQMSPPQQKQQG